MPRARTPCTGPSTRGESRSWGSSASRSRHPGDDRRTIYLAGDPGPAESRPPEEALGLVDVTRQSPGEPYTAGVDWGDELAGELWSVSEQQIAMTVNGWGDGLLVLTGRWTGEESHGAAGAVLTTYGLDDETFAALQARWTAWWDDHYPEPDPGRPASAPDATPPRL
ncbi:MAG: hypothetical protein H0V26_00540 [Solirubrobacterales bacterium]|nr:hypothetical protein [Solirubrobacterales bacterium]